MLFPTTEFAIFFALVFLGHWLLNPHPVRWKVFMIAASYFFYGWWTISYVWLLAAASTIAQLGALGVHHAKNDRQRKWAMIAGVGGLLGLLGYFKYYQFFSLNVYNGLNRLGIHSPLSVTTVLLPIGISFYTFMAISYVVDVYRRETQPSSWLDTFVYLSFFPHLVAGPIVRTEELVPQIRAKRDPRNIDASRAAYLIMGGLFKKVVLSSYRRDGHRRPRVPARRPSTRRSRSCSGSTGSPCRSSATSAGTPTSRSDSRCCSGSGSRRTSTGRTPRARCRTSGGGGT